MSDQKLFYLKPEDYLTVIHRAHSQYIKTRLDGPFSQLNGVHASDLAVESSAFFETAYLVLDSLADYYSQIEHARREALDEALEKSKNDWLEEQEQKQEPAPTKKKKKRGKK